MTNDCNLNCAYCSVLFDCRQNNVPIKPAYDLEKLIDFIDNTQKKYNRKDLVVYFFGGEPSLEYGECLRYARRMRERLSHYELRLLFHTNGLTLNEMPDELLKELDLMMFSINYELVPHHYLAPGYYSRIMTNLLQMREKAPDLPVIGRLTVTEQSSLYANAMMAAPHFDMIYWQLENSPQFKDYKAYAESYRFEVELLFRVWYAELKKGRLLPYVPFMSVLKFMFCPDRSDNEFRCGYDKHMVYIQTHGKCYACCESVASDTHVIGDLENGIEFRNLHLSDFVCKDCDYRYLCGGRCGRMLREFTQEHIDEYCRLNKFMFDLFLARKEELTEIMRQHPEFEEQLTGWILDTNEYTA